MTINFQDYLKTSAEEINLELDKFLEKWSREVKLTNKNLPLVNQYFIDACEGGKRIRGVLVKLGYELATRLPTTDYCGRRKTEDGRQAILPIAVAYELFQTAILAHDDIVDLSPLRRGKPTIYKALGGDHYGVSQTICLGDIGFFLAYRLISESKFGEKEKNLAVASFTDSMLKTALGEVLDIEIPHLKGEKIEKDALTIFKLKTAYYTLVGPLTLGAILGKGSKKLLEDIKDFGISLGIAFQIQDDILGVFGDVQTLGKSVTSDIEEDKLTLLIIYALKNAKKKQKEILGKLYGKKGINISELGEIREVFKKTGALEYSQKFEEKLVLKAKKVIMGMKISTQHKSLLNQMADFLVQRDK
ncbi:MAG: polyprenyl synthetase family protein [Candidatus Daviesbacteria bacterium]